MSKAWTVVVILVCMALSQFALDVYLPSLPSMVQDLQTSITQVQLTVSVFLIAVGISQLFYGSLSDSFGRKPIMLVGLSVFIVGSALCMLAVNINELLAGRLLQGLGAGFGTALSRAIMADVFKGKEMAKIATYQAMAWVCVPLMAPLLGGYVEHYLGWRANFVIIFISGILALTLIAFKYQETKSIDTRVSFHPVTLLKNYAFLLTRRKVLGYTIPIVAVYSVVIAMIQLAPFIFQDELGVHANIYGWIMFSIGAVNFMALFVNRYLSQRLNGNQLIMLGFAGEMVAFLFMLLMALLGYFNVWVVLIPLIAFRLFAAFIYPNCVVANMSLYPHLSGSLSALFGAIIVSSGSVASAIYAHIPQYQQLSLTLIAVVGVLLGMVAYYFLAFRAKVDDQNGSMAAGYGESKSSI